MSAIVVAGNTSGSVTLDAPAVAGTTVITLPTTSGTMVTTTSGTATTATNISNTGTVTLATAIENNAINIVQPSYTANTPVKLLAFNWYSSPWSLGNIRAGDSSSNGLGIFYGASNTELGRFTTSGWSGNAATATALSTATGSAPSYAARAWVNFNGTGTIAINASGNVSSITDGGVGLYTVNMTNAMPDINYEVNASASWSGVSYLVVSLFMSGASRVAPTTTAFRVSPWNGSTVFDAVDVCISVFR